MKIFIWENLTNVSECYHSGGGLVIIAENSDKAKHVARTNPAIQELPLPDIVLNLHPMHREIEEQLIVFPNAGCC